MARPSRFALSVAIAAIAVIAAIASAAEGIVLYPGPEERYRSPLYQVTVDDAGPAFVYYRENGWKPVPDKDGRNWELQAMSADNNWVGLSARGALALTVKPVGIEAKQAELLPERDGNSITIAADGAVRVTLKLADTQANHYFVRINGEHGNKHPLFIFVDPPDTQAPDRREGVHFFAPGVHDIGPHYALKANDTVYIAAGAVVRGTLTANGAGITIRGRGVLSGELLQEEWVRHKRGFIEKPKDARSFGIAPMIWNEHGSDGIVVEGITIIDAPSYNLCLNGGKHMNVRNVKVLSWNYSTDGIGGGPELVENCFFKVNDDVFTTYHSDVAVRNLVIWKQLNAAVFQLGYGYPMTVRNWHASRIDIIRDETNVQCGARAIISLEASKGCAFAGRFEDIKVYGDTLNLLAIDNLNQDTPWAANVKDVRLRGIDLELRRVTLTGTERGQWWTPFMDRKGQPMRSRLRTGDPGSIQVLFDQVSINGKTLRAASDFPHGVETEGDVRLQFR